MSLWDVDKTGDTRSNPQLNEPDVLQQMMAKGTTSVHPTTADTTTTGYLKTNNGQILGNNGTNNIGLFGFDSTGNMVLKIAKPGYNADTAANADLIFNSGQNTFKITTVLSSTFTLTSGGVNPSSTTFSINHSLGYVPMTISTIDISTLTNGSTGIYPVPFFTPGVGGGTTNVFVMLSFFRVRAVTSTSITYELGIQAPTQTFSGTVYCYFLQETVTNS